MAPVGAGKVGDGSQVRESERRRRGRRGDERDPGRRRRGGPGRGGRLVARCRRARAAARSGRAVRPGASDGRARSARGGRKAVARSRPHRLPGRLSTLDVSWRRVAAPGSAGDRRAQRCRGRAGLTRRLDPTIGAPGCRRLDPRHGLFGDHPRRGRSASPDRRDPAAPASRVRRGPSGSGRGRPAPDRRSGVPGRRRGQAELRAAGPRQSPPRIPDPCRPDRHAPLGARPSGWRRWYASQPSTQSSARPTTIPTTSRSFARRTAANRRQPRPTPAPR